MFVNFIALFLFLAIQHPIRNLFWPSQVLTHAMNLSPSASTDTTVPSLETEFGNSRGDGPKLLKNHQGRTEKRPKNT